MMLWLDDCGVLDRIGGVARPEKLFVLRGDDEPELENCRRMAGGVAGFFGMAVLLT